jgi:hypothetical protein
LLNYKLSNKKIILFSSQAWGEMLLSKHHYAITLARRGNEVYFINPPLNRYQRISLKKISIHQNLKIVSFGILGIQKVRFHNQFLFKLLTRYNLSRLKMKVCKQPDVIWNFDFNGYCDYSMFQNAVKIAHAVDFVPPELKRNIEGATILFSVSNEIIEDLKEFSIPGFFINHGIHEEFLKAHNQEARRGVQIKVGYVGNLLRLDVNHDLILRLVKTKSDVEFVFIGNYKPSNVGGANFPSGSAFINQLKQYKNANLTGVLGKEELASKMQEVDIFLIAYDKEKDFCKGTNYHKVMEYLAVGNVIVSNHVSTYENLDLLEMVGKEGGNEQLVSIFDVVRKNLDHYNSATMKKKRFDFAMNNSYTNQVDRIESILSQQQQQGL